MGVARLALAAGLCGLAVPAPAAETPARLRAILEVDRDAYYAGDPVPVRISVWNDGGALVEGPGGAMEAGFELYDVDGQKIAPTGGGDALAEGASAAKLRPGAFVGFARDLTALYPRLKQAGTYRLRWSGSGIASNAVILRVVPRYDPATEYVARVDTDLGSFTIELFGKEAPLAVKTFVELASTGFYDGVLFHYVEPGRLVASGDQTGTGAGGPGFAVPVEKPPVKMLAGTVFMRPSGQPPSNGSVFAILLGPRPDYEGQYTALGQVVEGMEVVGRISQVPASPKAASPPHRPLKDIRITRVTIKPKAA